MKTVCPNCSQGRKKKTDPCLSVNITKGAARCWNCEETSWRDEKQIEAPREYTQPPAQWQNYTTLSDPLVKWWAARGISQATLIECRITEEKAFIPRDGKEMNCTVFNYFHQGKLVNKKYRSGKKGFTQVKGAKKTFYNIDNIVGESECFLVEGEADTLALWQHGIKNAISVPNGASDLNDIFDTCANEINAIELFYIAVDMDEPGRGLEAELVKRLGKHRCKRINWAGKDANDDLISLKIEASLKNVTDYPIEGTFTTADLSAEIDDLYLNGLPAPLKVKNDWAADINPIFGTLRGQLTTFTGIPSHGKSTFVEWYLLNLIVDHDLKASMYSPEHLPMKLHHAYLAEKVIGKPFQNKRDGVGRMSVKELEDYKEWAKTRLFLTAPEQGKSPSWGWLIDTFKQQVFRYGIDIFVIDAFNKVKRKTDSLMELSDILSDLSLFCQYHNVCVFLIAHPTKMKKKADGSGYETPTLYDIKGTGDFYDQTHNGATIYRYFGNNGYTEFFPLKLKFRHQGEPIGDKTASLSYNIANGRYHIHPTGKPDYDSLIHVKQTGKQTTLAERIWQDKDDDIFTPSNELDSPF